MLDASKLDFRFGMLKLESLLGLASTSHLSVRLTLKGSDCWSDDFCRASCKTLSESYSATGCSELHRSTW